MKKSIISLLLLLLTCQAFSQTISGRLVDDKQQAIGFASIVLQQTDSTFVTGATSENNGDFSLSAPSPGNYLLVISFIGYKTEKLRLDNLSKPIKLGNILLMESSQQLGEITVTAKNSIRAIDKQIIMPTEMQLKVSNNGYDLLNSMMLARLKVDPIMKTLSVSGGGNVLLQINNVKATQAEVSALKPGEIIRVEYMNEPGSRYENENVGAVINFITRRKESGGSISIETMNSPHVAFGDNSIYGKFNYKLSQFSLNYGIEYRAVDERWRDEKETYFLEGGPLQRIQEGLMAPLENQTHNIGFSYNLYKQNKYLLNIAFRDYIYHEPKDNWKSRMVENGDLANSILSETEQNQTSQSPSLDIYFQQTLKNKQQLRYNLVGTYISNDYQRTYTETDLPTPYITNTEGEKYSLIGEAIYLKNAKKINWQGGVKHSQMYSNNKYLGSNPVTSQMNQAQTYVFAEMSGKLNKFGYTLGVGGMRTYFSESDKEYRFYTFCPRVRMSYAFSDDSYLSYTFSSRPTVPSLGSLTDVEQSLDDYLVSRGNPNLEPYRVYRNNLSYDYSVGLFALDSYLSYSYYDKPVMEQFNIEGQKVILTEMNQNSFQKLNGEISLRLQGVSVGTLKNFLSISLTGGYSRFFSKGTNYNHVYDDWYYSGQAILMYKKFAFMANYILFQSTLYGETITRGENQQSVMLLYNTGNLQAGVGMLFPFSSTFKEGYERVSKVAPVDSWTRVNESSRMVVLKLSYSFGFGKSYKSAKKMLENTDTDSGILNMKK